MPPITKARMKTPTSNQKIRSRNSPRKKDQRPPKKTSTNKRSNLNRRRSRSSKPPQTSSKCFLCFNRVCSSQDISLPKITNLQEIGIEAIKNSARQQKISLPEFGSKKLSDRHIPYQATFRGAPFSVPTKQTPSEPSSCVIDCDLFPFPNGVNPAEDSIMTDKAEAMQMIGHSLGEIFTS